MAHFLHFHALSFERNFVFDRRFPLSGAHDYDEAEKLNSGEELIYIRGYIKANEV